MSLFIFAKLILPYLEPALDTTSRLFQIRAGGMIRAPDLLKSAQGAVSGSLGRFPLSMKFRFTQSAPLFPRSSFRLWARM